MKSFILIVSVLFVIGGSISTLNSKWADLLDARDRSGEVSTFGHPFFQSFLMFFGEFMCMGAFTYTLHSKRQRGEEIIEGVDIARPCNKLLFLIPATCDFTASTMMFVGLTMTQASVYQMLKGATVLFTALFSFIFLGRRFVAYEYLGMLLVVMGLGLVGGASMFGPSDKKSASNPVLGNTLILSSQVIASAQMVIEERIIHKYGVPPFQVVGWEGFFGLSMATFALALFQAFDGKPDDGVQAVEQMYYCWQCSLSVMTSMVGVPLYNATAVTITKHISATARMVLDTCRNVIVWIVTLSYSSFFREEFSWIQLVGFLCIVTGTGIFKNLIKLPCDALRAKEEDVDPDSVEYGTIHEEERSRVPTEMDDRRKPQ